MKRQTMSLKGCLLLIVSLGMLVICGCIPVQESYEQGRAAGIEEGKRLGYDQGYKKGLAEGFEKYKPSTPSNLSGFGKTVYKLIVWGGCLKVLLSLGFAALLILGESKDFGEGLGKFLFGIMGSAFSILAVTYLHISQIAEEVLLVAAPSSLWWQAAWTIGSAVVMYGLLEAILRFIEASHSTIIEGWVMFILASVMTLMGPLLWGLFSEVPDITRYFAANLLSGVLVGGIYWIAHGLLSGKLTEAIAKLEMNA